MWKEGGGYQVDVDIDRMSPASPLLSRCSLGVASGHRWRGARRLVVRVLVSRYKIVLAWCRRFAFVRWMSVWSGIRIRIRIRMSLRNDDDDEEEER